MATAKKDETTEAPTDEAEKARIAKGEMTGKVRGQDVDSSYHVYEFTDPKTGEPLETHQVIHDVATGVNEDGSLKMGKGNDDFVKPAKDGESSSGTSSTTSTSSSSS